MRDWHRIARLVAGLWALALLVSCTPAIAPGASPATTSTALPGADPDTVAIYATVVRRLCMQDDSFGGRFNPAVVYLVRQTNDAAGDPSTPKSASITLAEGVQQGVSAALVDLPARVIWVDSSQDAPKSPVTGEVEGHGVVVTLGNIARQSDGTVHVPASIFVASLAASGQTYVLQKKGDAWVVTGNTGVRWMS